MMQQPDQVSDRHWQMFADYVQSGASVQTLAKEHGVKTASVSQAINRTIRLYLEQERYRRVMPPTTFEKAKRARTEVVCEIMMTTNIKHKDILRHLFKFAPWLFGDLADAPFINYTKDAYQRNFDVNACVQILEGDQ